MWDYLAEMALLRSISGFYFGLAMVIFLVAIRRFSRYQEKPPYQEAEDWPSVSVLVPARNEAHALEEFLENLLAAEYPKLEIIVVDDESNDNTTEIIRSFAHRGVRFLAGKPLLQGWIGKNFALHQLTEAASGEYLIYCDVDVRIQPDTIRKIIEYTQHYQVDFASFIPQLNMRPASAWLRHPLTSFWLHILPWSIINKTPAMGNVMAFRNSALQKVGSWRQFSSQLLPEAAIADRLNRKGHYQLIAGKDYGISLLKKPSSFDETRQRYFYTVLGARGWGVLLASLAAFGLLLMPFILAVSSLLAQDWATLQLTALTCGLLIGAYGVTVAKNSRRPWLATLFFPASLVWEIALMWDSYFQYRRREMHWKNRHLSRAQFKPTSR